MERFNCITRIKGSLRSRRLEVVGERENGRARGRHACLLLARPFFLVPTTSKRLLRRLNKGFSFLRKRGVLNVGVVMKSNLATVMIFKS